jgi:hypothetical protein
MKEDKKDIFKEAMADSIKKQIENKVDDDKKELPPGTLVEIKERLEDGETQWDLLKKMIDGSLTEKFIGILMNMPDRDFARNYLKLIEYSKPKLIRAEGAEIQQPDNTININLAVINNKGEREIISAEDIEHKEIKDNKKEIE